MNYNEVKKHIADLVWDFNYLTVVEYPDGVIGHSRHATLMSALKSLVLFRKSGLICEVVMKIEGMYYLHTNTTYKVFATQKEIDHYAKLGQNYVGNN